MDRRKISGESLPGDHDGSAGAAQFGQIAVCGRSNLESERPRQGERGIDRDVRKVGAPGVPAVERMVACVSDHADDLDED